MTIEDQLEPKESDYDQGYHGANTKPVDDLFATAADVSGNLNVTSETLKCESSFRISSAKKYQSKFKYHKHNDETQSPLITKLSSSAAAIDSDSSLLPP